MKRIFATVLLLTITAIWGWTFVIVEDAVKNYAVFYFLAIRFSLAAAAMAPIVVYLCFRADRQETRVDPKKSLRHGLLVGAGIGILLAAAYYFQTAGLAGLTKPSYSGLITGLFIVFGPIVNRLLFGIRTSFYFWSAISVAVLGLVMLTGIEPVTREVMIGNGLTLVCALLFGVHIALLDRYAEGIDTTLLAFSQIAMAAILFWIFALATETYVPPTREVWWAVAICGLLATAVAYFGQTFAQQLLPAVRVVIILSMEPVFAAIFGVLLNSDKLTLVQILGGVLMVGAMTSAEVYNVMKNRSNGSGHKPHAQEGIN